MTAVVGGAVPRLSGRGLTLSAWEERDLPAILELADPVVREWSPSFRTLRTLDDARRWLMRKVEDPDRVEWAVRDDGTGDAIGRVSLHHFTPHPDAAEIGYGVHHGHRGRGVARQAVELATAHGFDALGLRRVSLIHAVGNAASCAVATRAGFSFEGVERQALDHGDGVLHDLHRHARLPGDPPGPADPAPAPLDTPLLHGHGLQLRPWQTADAAVYLRGLSDPAAARWNPSGPPGTVADAERLVARMRRRAVEGVAVAWAVESGGAVVGSVGLRGIDLVDRCVDAAYFVLPEARGRGIAPRALQVATAYAFEQLDLHRVQLQHAVANTASCRVAEKAGFALEATLRDSCLLADGFVDEHQHARVRVR